jgi:hypothetical protein
MGVDLVGSGNAASFNWHGWRRLLDVAKEFGWQPEGTQPPSDHVDGSWEGTYFSNDYQEITTSDAGAMGAALFRASAAKRSGAMTEKQRELLNGTPLSMIDELADLASSGNFYIG